MLRSATNCGFPGMASALDIRTILVEAGGLCLKSLRCGVADGETAGACPLSMTSCKDIPHLIAYSHLSGQPIAPLAALKEWFEGLLCKPSHWNEPGRGRSVLVVSMGPFAGLLSWAIICRNKTGVGRSSWGLAVGNPSLPEKMSFLPKATYH